MTFCCRPICLMTIYYYVIFSNKKELQSYICFREKEYVNLILKSFKIFFNGYKQERYILKSYIRNKYVLFGISS